MEVRFHRTADRRYAITVQRESAPLIEMNPAPGYDPLVPHDLLHLVVESELGLRRGIFGQVAAGGDAGTFRRDPEGGGSRRERARRRRRAARRGERLEREGRDEAAQSERATLICLYEWLSRSGEPDRRRAAARLAPGVRHLRAIQPPAEREALGPKVIGRICARLDALSARWAGLEIGGSMAVTWPDAERSSRPGGAR